MIRKSNGQPQPQPQSGASTTSNASSAQSFLEGQADYEQKADDINECPEEAKRPGDVAYCVNKHPTFLAYLTSLLKSGVQLGYKSDSKTDIAEKTDLDQDQKRDSELETEVNVDAFGRSSSPPPFTTYYSDDDYSPIWGARPYQLLNNNLSGQVYDDHCSSSLHGKE